jgi:hypothetical protein
VGCQFGLTDNLYQVDRETIASARPDLEVAGTTLMAIDGPTQLSIPKTLLGGFCGGKQNRTMIKSDGGPRKPSVGIYLELLPVA